MLAEDNPQRSDILTEKVNPTSQRAMDINADIMICQQEREFYIETFSKAGIDAPLNYYRSMNHRYESEQGEKLFVLSVRLFP